MGYKLLTESQKIIKNLKILGDSPKFITPLIQDFVNYCRIEIGIDNNIVIELNFKSINKNEFGFVNFSKIINGKDEIIIDKNVGYCILFPYIAHELTHIKQINNLELMVENGFFVWKNIVNITVDEYNMIVKKHDLDAYTDLEWEKEAYFNQNIIFNNYLNSIFFNNLMERTVEPNLHFILHNAFEHLKRC